LPKLLSNIKWLTFLRHSVESATRKGTGGQGDPFCPPVLGGQKGSVPVFSCQAANCSILVAAAAKCERPDAETAAGPVDSERSSVSRTQFSGAYIGDQLTDLVVCHVSGGL